jgi:hypothetical protein
LIAANLSTGATATPAAGWTGIFNGTGFFIGSQYQSVSAPQSGTSGAFTTGVAGEICDAIIKGP